MFIWFLHDNDLKMVFICVIFELIRKWYYTAQRTKLKRFSINSFKSLYAILVVIQNCKRTTKMLGIKIRLGLRILVSGRNRSIVHCCHKSHPISIALLIPRKRASIVKCHSSSIRTHSILFRESPRAQRQAVVIGTRANWQLPFR